MTGPYHLIYWNVLPELRKSSLYLVSMYFWILTYCFVQPPCPNPRPGQVHAGIHPPARCMLEYTPMDRMNDRHVKTLIKLVIKAFDLASLTSSMYS